MASKFNEYVLYCDTGSEYSVQNRTYLLETKGLLAQYCVHPNLTSKEDSFDGERSITLFLTIDIIPEGKLETNHDTITETYYISDDNSKYILWHSWNTGHSGVCNKPLKFNLFYV